jgi:hypothetical protein
MSGIIIISTLSAVSIVGIIAAVRVTLSDGFRRVPTRSL